MTARTRCGPVKLRECCEFIYVELFPLWLKGAVYESYVRSAILCGSEALCLRVSQMIILWAEECLVRAALVAISVRWYDDVSRMEDGHVLKMELDFESDGQRKKGR